MKITGLGVPCRVERFFERGQWIIRKVDIFGEPCGEPDFQTSVKDLALIVELEMRNEINRTL